MRKHKETIGILSGNKLAIENSEIEQNRTIGWTGIDYRNVTKRYYRKMVQNGTIESKKTEL